MTIEPESRRWRAKQVGMLMRAYRQAYRVGGRAGRLSQTGLLDLMGQVDEKYSELHGHSTVARWESGATNPSRDRLRVFGQALDLSPVEINGLMRLAGFQSDDASPTGKEKEVERPPVIVADIAGAATQHDGRETAAELSWGESKSYVSESLKSVLSQLLPSGLFIAIAGFILSWSEWNADWMVLAYVFVAIGLVLVRTLMKMVPSGDLRDLYLASVFILLSIPLLQAPFIRMDPYGFFTIGGLANTPMPYLLALLVNLILALAAGLMFNFLWQWEYSRPNQGKRNVRRAVLAVLPPLLFVFGCNLAVSSIGFLVYLSSVLPLLAGVFSALAVLHERNATSTDLNRKYILWAVAVLTIVLIVLNGAAIVVVNLLPGVIILPDGGLFNSWDIDYSALGYPQGDLGSQLQLGVLWTSFVALASMVITMAGHLAFSVYRHGKGASTGPAMTIPISLALLIGIGGLALAGSSNMRAQPADFDAAVEDVWLVASMVAAGDSAEIKARFRNRSSFSGPHDGDAGFDVSIVIQSPTGSTVRHEVNNQPFSYNEKWIFTAEHTFDQVGTYTVSAEIYDIDGQEKGWNASHRFDIRSKTFTIGKPKGDQ